MFRRKYLVIATLAALLTVAGGCTGDTLDDGGGADVIMQILVLDNPPVTASLDEATSSCTFTVEDWNAIPAYREALAQHLGEDGTAPFRAAVAARMPAFNVLARTLYDNWRRTAFTSPA